MGNFIETASPKAWAIACGAVFILIGLAFAIVCVLLPTSAWAWVCFIPAVLFLGTGLAFVAHGLFPRWVR